MVETIVTKMSVKTIGCNPRAAAALQESDHTPIRLCIIAGTADGAVTKEDSKNQLFTYLTGDFRAQVTQDGQPDVGKCYRSGKLFLPGGIQETVENAIKEASKNNGAGMVTFGLEIFSVRATNPIGYSYQARPLMKPTAEDPLNLIWRQITAGPETDDAPAPPVPPAAEPAAPAAASGKSKK